MSSPSSAFTEHGVVPDVIEVGPPAVLEATWDGKVSANLGNELKPDQVKHQPTINWQADEKQYYTVIMTDPDAPSRKDPKFGEWRHWIVANVPGNNVKQGEVMAEYIGAGPPQGTGLHRYVLLVVKQNGKVDLSKEKKLPKTGADRAKWKAKDWVQKHLGVNLSEALVAGNFFQAEYDEYVPKLYAELEANSKA